MAPDGGVGVGVGCDAVFPTVVENGCEPPVDGAVDTAQAQPGRANRKCTLIFSVRDMNALSRVFKTFEVSAARRVT